MTLLSLGKQLSDRRGGRGIREFARELGVSPATLSRIENGKLPDLDTFSKICSYLELDPAEILQVDVAAKRAAEASAPPIASVHFKADQVLDPGAAADLGALIFAADQELRRVKA